MLKTRFLRTESSELLSLTRTNNRYSGTVTLGSYNYILMNCKATQDIDQSNYRLNLLLKKFIYLKLL